MFKKLIKPKNKRVFDPGPLVFAWEAFDYHPHERGWLWYVIWLGALCVGTGWMFWTGEWSVALMFLFVAALYYFVHRNGHETHHIHVYKKGIRVDKTFFGWDRLEGYWFIWNERQGAAIVNIQVKNNGDRKIPLQMGHLTPDELREVFDEVSFPELVEKKEGLVDLWIRVFKL